MKKGTELTEAGRQYAAAYAAHYTERDLPAAIHLYMKVISSYPSEQESGFSRMQMQNIINAVVPSQELLDAQIELALAHLEHQDAPDARRVHAPPLASELSA